MARTVNHKGLLPRELSKQRGNEETSKVIAQSYAKYLRNNIKGNKARWKREQKQENAKREKKLGDRRYKPLPSCLVLRMLLIVPVAKFGTTAQIELIKKERKSAWLKQVEVKRPKS